MSEGISHWAEKLEIGDKCLATIRHKTDGTKNLHNVEVIVIDNDWEKKEISAWFPEYKVLIPYNELKPKEGFMESLEQKFEDSIQDEEILNWFLDTYPNIIEVSDWHCEICEMPSGKHENGCPNNIDPRQNLLTDGFD